MNEFKFRCLMCGRCCHEVAGTKDDPTIKRIPLYPEEANRLKKFSDDLGIEMSIIEDVIFPDVKNKKILVLTYRILLNNKEKVCPFHDRKVGCLIQDKKPLACLAYPLAVQQIDAFNMKIDIDPLCKFTVENYQKLRNSNANNIKEIYDIEYKRAQNMLIRNKQAIFKIKMLELEKKITIPKSIESSIYIKSINNWDRVEIDSLNEDVDEGY